MSELLSRLGEYLDDVTGSKGTLGYLTILALVVVGYAYTGGSAPTASAAENQQQRDGEMADEEEEEDPPRNFTAEQLAYFDGTKEDRGDDDKPVYLSVDGTVFDVSKGRDFYGPDGPYEMFAGKECGAALAKMLFDDELIGNLDAVSDLKYAEKCELDGWIEKFRDYRCYPVKGRYVPPNRMPDPDRVVSKEELEKYDGSSSSSSGSSNGAATSQEGSGAGTAASGAASGIPEGYATAPIYVAAGGKVFDVSFGGSSFYGAGGPYSKFAGKDVSRALATMSLDGEEIERGGDLSGLTEKQLGVLADWVKTFEERKKYPIVGRTEQQQPPK